MSVGVSRKVLSERGLNDTPVYWHRWSEIINQWTMTFAAATFARLQRPQSFQLHSANSEQKIQRRSLSLIDNSDNLNIWFLLSFRFFLFHTFVLNTARQSSWRFVEYPSNIKKFANKKLS